MVDRFFKKITEILISYTRVLYLFFTLLLIAPLFIYFGESSSIISWMLAYLLLAFLIKVIEPIVVDRNNFEKVVKVSFFCLLYLV